MDEKQEQKTEEKKTSSTPLLDEAQARAERLEKATAEFKLQADRLEKLQSDMLLSGSAGIRPADKPAMTEEELKKKQALEFWKGTAIADAIAKQK